MPRKPITSLDSSLFSHAQWGLPHEYLDILRKAWRDRRLVLIFGAGVSQPYGLPNWDALVLDILLASGPGIAIDKTDPRAVASWVVDRLQMSPDVLARVARATLMPQLSKTRKLSTDTAFATFVRDILYRKYRIPDAETQTSMWQAISIIARSEMEGRRIPFLITFNFDNILEMRLQVVRIASTPVYGPTRPNTSAVPIFHPHGFLPYKDRVPTMDLVFTEAQYHRLALSTFHWASVKLFEALSEHTCLMIGLSLADPNLRRMLDAIPRKPKTPSHFLVRKMPALTLQEVRDAIADIQLNSIRAADDSLQVRKANSRLVISSNNPHNFGEVLRLMMKYESQSLLDLGVAPLWIQSFEDLPSLLVPITNAD
jgi:SIR2-like protein